MLQNFGQKLSCVDDNNYMQGEIPLQKRNYLLECGPLVVQAYPTHQASVLGTHLYQCNIRCCCERLCSASVIIFWRLFQCICPFHDGWFTSTPAHTALSIQQFLTKNGTTPCPTIPIYQSCPKWLLFWVSPDEKTKVLKRGCFASVEDIKQKTAEALKGIKINKFKDCFEQWERKHFDMCIASNGVNSEGEWSLNM